ncbi:MAG TPA: ATP-binding cassette domain-containing protein [Gemmatimonadaceae bacterium]|nr:ATP-binding cassette domain-containing protein [Gemmatimonadaceae bacterium]
MPPVLLLDGVHKTYRAGIPGCCASARVLQGVHLRVAAGELVGIAGAPGAGKTTLLLCAAGLLRPDVGRVRWGGALPPGGAPGAAYVSGGAPEWVGRAPTAAVREALARPAALPALEPTPAAPALLLVDDAPLLLGERAGLVLRWLAMIGVAAVVTASDPRWLRDVGARTLILFGGTLRPPLTAGTARRPA